LAARALLVLNGQILGTLGSEVVPTAEDVVSISIICLEVVERDRKVGLAAIAVTTETGAEAFMRSHLQALSARELSLRASLLPAE